MASKKHRKSRSTKRRYKGGFVFNQPTYNSSETNPYTTYDVNTYSTGDPSRDVQNTRNLVGGKRRRKTNKRRSRKTKGGFFTPLKYGFIEDLYGNNNPKIV